MLSGEDRDVEVSEKLFSRELLNVESDSKRVSYTLLVSIVDAVRTGVTGSTIGIGGIVSFKSCPI